MTTRLNQRAFAHAKERIIAGRFAYDERDAWSEHRPSAADENDFVRRQGFREYAKWHLGINDDKAEDTKAHYSYPYGDFEKVHRCGLLAAESRAGQYKHQDIENAAAHLHGMIEGRAGAAIKGRKPAARRDRPATAIRPAR
jgi:hypothetical protein